jgi:hypothetical protein
VADRLLRWLRTEGLDLAEYFGMITIAVGVFTYLTSLGWPWMIALTLCVGLRMHRRAEQTAELSRYRRGQQ